MSKCSECGNKVSFWKEYNIDGKSYCEECYNKKKKYEEEQILEKEPKLSQKTILEIKEARERIKKGEFYTEEEAKKILGI